MFKSQCLLFCVVFIVGCYGSLVPFIDKCVWHDKACLKASANKALPHLCGGKPELGVGSFDPLIVNELQVNEGGLSIDFNNVKLTGICNCKILNLERNEQKSLFLIEAECPIQIHGNYKANGTLLFVPVTGNGPFDVTSKNIYISVKVGVKTVDGSDGQKFWKLGKFEHLYDFKEKAVMKFENLFDGDQEKARPVLDLLEHSWKEIVNLFGGPFVNKLIHHIAHGIGGMFQKVSTSELEVPS